MTSLPTPSRRQARHAATGRRLRRVPLPQALLLALMLALMLAGPALPPASAQATEAAPGGLSGPGSPGAAQPATSAPTRWQAELPHGGQDSALAAWWSQFDEPQLPMLIAAAQAASPDLAGASARIAQAEASRVAADSALWPKAFGLLSASRGRPAADAPVSTSAGLNLQASWELDLFGGQRATRDAAVARLAGAQADWHEARVSLAAEVASSLLALRACEQLAQQAEADAASRAETARLTGLAQAAGFEAPATAALAQAAAAQATLNARSRQVLCGQQMQALSTLTALDLPSLRQRLAPRSARLPQPAQLAVGSVPAQALAQRPDLFSRARALEAAAAEVTSAQALMKPGISLAGSVGPASVRSAGFTTNGTVWSLGPLQVTLPIFDLGGRRSNISAAQARYDEALASYQGRLRQAVAEVEDALLRLQGGTQRRAHAQAAVAGFDTALAATTRRQQAGLASRLELEDARRSLLQARGQQVDTEREQVAAWIALYRALGGGWVQADLGQAGAGRPPPAPVSTSTSTSLKAPFPAPAPAAQGG